MCSLPPPPPSPAWWERDSADSLTLTFSPSPVHGDAPEGEGRRGGEVWARQIQVFIERSYGMTVESHYLLIKYWSRAVQVLTSKLIWADPWDQWLGVCVCVCVCVQAYVCVHLCNRMRNSERWRERKKGARFKVGQVEREQERKKLSQ